MLGRFLEVSVPAPAILDSWEWYQRLGLTPAPVGEAWPHRYAVVTDGRLALGLHAESLEAPVLTFVRPGLAGHLAALAAHGIAVQRAELGDDRFHEAAFDDPDGHGLRLVEARTWSMPDRTPPTLLGWFEEVALPVRDLEAARGFWERLGFVAAGGGDAPWPYLALTSDHLNVGLYRTRELAGPALVFVADDLAAVGERLATAGVAPESGGRRADELALVAPEGTRLLVRPG